MPPLREPASLIRHSPVDTILSEGIILRGGLACRQTTTFDIFIFYALNYFLHALTVRIEPGATRWAKFFIILGCLLFPYAGIFQALTMLLDAPIAGKTDLERAQRARALWTLARGKNWQPRQGEELLVKGCIITRKKEGGLAELKKSGTVFNTKKLGRAPTSHMEKNSVHFATGRKAKNKDRGDSNVRLCMSALSYWDGKAIFSSAVRTPMTPHRRFFGRHHFPEGYELVPVNPHVLIEPGNGISRSSDVHLSYGENISNTVAALAQIFAGTYSLYSARGSQFDEYGYSAFALTTIPYILMSLLNLFSTVVSFDYPAIYIVRSEAMDEAEKRYPETFFEGVVGKIVTGGSTENNPNSTNVILRGTDKDGEVLYKVLESRQNAYDRYKTFNSDNPNTWKHAIKGPEKRSPTANANSILYPSLGQFKQLPIRTIDRFHFPLALFLILLLYLAPFGIIEELTDFKTGYSAKTSDRLWSISWLVFGQLYGIVVFSFFGYDDPRWEYWDIIIGGTSAVLAAAPAIGGFYTVGRQLIEYGWCVEP